ncbi:MAG: hypothetical protein OXT05_00360 [Chloroflexota bacterium]|nr:hypothetical protein [Chloroflexota bacterium]
MNAYESTLNTWLAAALRERGLNARAEIGQGGGKRLDVEISLDGLKIALEAEQGFSTTKKASAIKDADSRLHDDLADCAIALCYPEGLRSPDELAGSELLYTLRSHKERPPATKTSWKRDHIPQLVSVIRKIPDQLGDPDEIANRLSFSLDRAVARLNESQKQDLAACLDLPAGKPTKSETSHALTSRFNQAAKRAMLVVATAVMFHSQLDKHRHKIKPRDYAGEWSPASASQCANSADPIGAFSQAWKLWLAVDYKPIFDTARSALQVLAGANEFTASVQIVARASLQVTRNIVGLRHDLLGRIFHKVLDTARYDGSFYTTTAAATLLANLALREDMLDWSDSEAIGGLRITDPACGTGTLLMAAAERIRDLTAAAGNQDEVSRLLIENVLTGYDVNLTATHLAATTLGLLSPTTTFGNMKIYRALLGLDENNEAKLGSLEFLDTGVDGQPRLLPWPTGVEQIETREESAEAEPADLVIMNPPFTRDSLRHDQFSRAQEQKLRAREKELFASHPVHLSSNGNAFMVLAEHIASAQSSAVAAILPLVTATNASALGIRKFLAEQFHIDTIITSHDPTRIYFSENTSIGEMLLICRRKAPHPPAPSPKMREGEEARGWGPPTTIVNLYENPATPADALGVARDIAEDRTENIKGTVQRWPHARIAQGDWGGVQFLSPYLCEKFVELREDEFFAFRELGDMADISPDGRGIRGMFKRSEVPDSKAMIALWDHKTDFTQKMSAHHDTYIITKEGKARQAEYLWAQRGTLLLAMRARLNTVRVVSVRLPERALGSAWVPCKLKSLGATAEKALCAYINSTIGLLAMLGDRSLRDLSYSQFSMDDLRRVIVPDFYALEASQVTALATAFDTLCNFTLLPLPQIMQDETRAALDRVVIDALDIAPEVVANIRRELSREPSITGKPYES